MVWLKFYIKRQNIAYFQKNKFPLKSCYVNFPLFWLLKLCDFQESLYNVFSSLNCLNLNFTAAKYWHNLRPAMSLLVDGTSIESVRSGSISSKIPNLSNSKVILQASKAQSLEQQKFEEKTTLSVLDDQGSLLSQMISGSNDNVKFHEKQSRDSSEDKSQSDGDNQSETEVQSGTEKQSKDKLQQETDTKINSENQSKNKTQQEGETQSDPENQAKDQAQSKTETQSDYDQQAEDKTEPDYENQSGDDKEPETEKKTKSECQMENENQSEGADESKDEKRSQEKTKAKEDNENSTDHDDDSEEEEGSFEEEAEEEGDSKESSSSEVKESKGSPLAVVYVFITGCCICTVNVVKFRTLSAFFSQA